jgi:hypothetical protein
MMSRLRSSALALALAAGSPACTTRPLPAATPAPAPYTPTAPLPGAVQVAFTIARGDASPGIFDVPWPTELLRRPNGRLDLRSFPARDTLLFGAYVAAAEEDVDGYSVAPTIYFHLTGPLPAPRFPASASADAPVFLVDVDPTSPERGAFFPLEHRHYPAALRFVPANTLAVKPVPGVILRPATLYAAVLRRDAGGAPLGTSMDLEIAKWTSPRPDPDEERARSLHRETFDLLASRGVARDRVAAVALFRTQVPHAVTARMLEVVTHLPPEHAPRLIDAAWADDRAAQASGSRGYFTVEGTYCTPNFQAGIESAPFLAEAGGKVTFDRSGAPRVVAIPPGNRYHSAACGDRMLARFVLTFPLGPMPAAGFPLMISAHGTGGDAETFLGADDFAGWAAAQGIAVVSTDQPLHGGRGRGARPGSREPITIAVAGIPIPIAGSGGLGEVAFYNPIHPAAARDNLRQAAVDGMVLARLIGGADFARARRADGSPLLAPAPGRIAPRFDRDRILVAGHSQGSQSTAVQGAIDPLVRGVILSGCGGDARLGILRRRDLPITTVFATLLGLDPGELDEFHPLMTLVQTLADPIDPQSYARLYWEPLPGRRPQNVLHYEGIEDTYTPPVTSEALARALRATPLAPIATPVAGLGEVGGVLGDLLGRAAPTRAFAQYRSTQHENGHFVLYHEPGAAELAMEFMRAVVGPGATAVAASPDRR